MVAPRPSQRPLVIVDVDEVLALFVRGFEAFLAKEGYEFRLTRFALFSNIFRPGGTEPVEIADGRILYDRFFAEGADLIAPAPGAAEALADLARDAEVVVLSNAPAHGQAARAAWLARHGMGHPLRINQGPKGPAIAALTEGRQEPAFFIDDLVSHLESCAEAAPRVTRFQMVADERLRPLAPADPKRHRRIDDWPSLHLAIRAGMVGP